MPWQRSEFFIPDRFREDKDDSWPVGDSYDPTLDGLRSYRKRWWPSHDDERRIDEAQERDGPDA